MPLSKLAKPSVSVLPTDRRALHPLRGERQNLPRTRSGGLDSGLGHPGRTRRRVFRATRARSRGILDGSAGSSPSPGRPLHSTPAPRICGRSCSHLEECNGVRCQAIRGDASLYPLQGERQNLPRTRSGFRRPRRKSVRGLPLMVSAPATTCGCNRIQATPFFTHSKGRGRTCPGTRSGIRASSPEIGEGSSGHPRSRYPSASIEGEGWSLPQPAPDAIRGTRSGGEGGGLERQPRPRTSNPSGRFQQRSMATKSPSFSLSLEETLA